MRGARIHCAAAIVHFDHCVMAPDRILSPDSCLTRMYEQPLNQTTKRR
jgi:hypothetical protein